MKQYKFYIIVVVALMLGLIIGLKFNSSKHIHEDVKDTVQSDSITDNQIYTCSMHPQIRRTHPGKCPICGMDLIPATDMKSSDENIFQMTPEAAKLADIQTTIVGVDTNNNAQTIHFNGRIQNNETKASSLVAHIPGRIEKLFISYTGEQVKIGQKIATVYSPELLTAQKELLESNKIKDISPGLLEAAKNKLKYWKINDKQISDILESGKVKEYFEIYAEYSGYVTLKKVSVGDYIAKGEVLFEVQDLNNLWGVFDVYENDLDKVRLGQTIYFNTLSEPENLYKSKISFINPIINPDTRTSSIRAELSNPKGKFKPDMFIVGQINSHQNTGNITVPKSAVLWTGTRSVVYVKVPDMKIPSYDFREIELGNPTESGYNVIKGLKIGEEVVTNGTFVIDASAQLNNQTSMMNRNVAVKGKMKTENLPDYANEIQSELKGQINELANDYLSLKDALVAGNYENAKYASNDLIASIGKIDFTLLKDSQQDLLKQNINELSEKVKKFSQSKDIKSQRVLIGLVKIKIF